MTIPQGYPYQQPIAKGFTYSKYHPYTQTLPDKTIIRNLFPGHIQVAKASISSIPKPIQQGQHRRNPIVLAQTWQLLLASGEIAARAEPPRNMGVSRAYVARVLSLLHLAPGLEDVIVALSDPIKGKRCGIHFLRPLMSLPHEKQMHWTRKLQPRAQQFVDSSYSKG